MLKERSILDLLEHLRIKYGQDSFVIQDHWEGDRCAIGLVGVNGRFLLYVNTFRRPPHKFHLEVEIVESSHRSEVVERFESASLDQVEQLFERYLGSSTGKADRSSS